MPDRLCNVCHRLNIWPAEPTCQPCLDMLAAGWTAVDGRWKPPAAQLRPCPHCDRVNVTAGRVTCGRSECQEAEYDANRRRNAERRASRRR